jgi:hypothetical protein
MFPALQPHRPQVIIQRHLLHSQSKLADINSQLDLHRPVPNPQIRESQSPSLNSSGHLTAPRNQIEAMPPFAPTPSPKLPPINLPFSHYNSAMLHPVFFTQSLRKLPFPLPNGASSSASYNPAAFGYIAETSGRRIESRPGTGTKL